MDAIAAEPVEADHGINEGRFVDGHAGGKLECPRFPDPLDEDSIDDELVLTTRRAIGRVALVAAETAARFQREGVEHDPMSWLWSPREVFDGAVAIDACLDREACLRAILVHGLGLGLDVGRSAVEELLASDDDDLDEHAFRHLYAGQVGGRDRTSRGRSPRGTRLRLYSATILDTRDNRMIQAFHASVAASVAEVRARLAGRFGPDIADRADVRPGLHVTSPPVVALVPEPVLELVRRMERDCREPYARTFAVDIELGIQA